MSSKLEHRPLRSVAVGEDDTPNISRSGHDGSLPFASELTRALELSSRNPAESVKGASQWLEALLKNLGRHEAFVLRLPFATTASPTITVRTRHDTRQDLDKRRAELEAEIDAVLVGALPGIRARSDCLPQTTDALRAYELRPQGQAIDEHSFSRLGLREVPHPESAANAAQECELIGVYVAQDLGRRPDLAALGHLMQLPALRDITVVIEIERFRRDARMERVLRRTYQPLANAIDKHTLPELLAKERFGNAVMSHQAWLNAHACQRLSVRVLAPEPVSPVLSDMICQALYGTTLASDVPDGYLDLTCAWPDCDLAWLERLPQLLEMRRELSKRHRLSVATKSGLRLGRLEDDSPVCLDPNARGPHIFTCGQPGSGKSTLMANMIAQDMEAGEAIVLYDPHGDLAKDVLSVVPRCRRKDVVFLHPTDAKGCFTLNVFESMGGKSEVEHNRVADDLIDLFKRVYPQPAEAYGPMFMQYARNAIFLLLSALGPEANVTQIQRVFADDSWRRELVKNCPREDVKTFWQEVAEGARGEPSLNNVAPYITAKLTQLSGNEVLRPIIGAQKSSLDFRKIVAERRICLIDLGLPEIGEEAAKILGGLLFSRLSVSLQMMAGKLPPEARIPLRVYLDEFQIYADDSLSKSMEQMRKFGMSYTLACQHFAELDGHGWRPNVGRSILGNAATLILFRLGIVDAHLLAPYVAPTITPEALIRLPNFHAAARLLPQAGETIDPLVLRTDPPPQSSNRSRRQLH